MNVHSAGILLHRTTSSGLEVWLGHMGGPFWARKQERAWSIPKGEAEPGEPDLEVARREFAEEIGSPAPEVEGRAGGAPRDPAECARLDIESANGEPQQHNRCGRR